ncbi:MAG: DUF4294 domain-containing protein [Prolixibacteraceae bacterium]|nr:DUF4294 domain-containing protein [Prolixibacteraceae bacterium]
MYKLLKKYGFLMLLLIQALGDLWGQSDSIALNIELGEVVVFQAYPFQHEKEERKYREMESDLRLVYPLIRIVRTEYARINHELSLYEGDREKEFLKWYEQYARENFMPYLSGLNPRQGRLFLKMISRELDNSPYDLIKEYRNGFRAVMWQGVALVFFSNLKTNYAPEENPMIEHIMTRLDAEHHHLKGP